MAFVTYADLAAVPRPLAKSAIRILAEAERPRTGMKVFLSHAHLDQEKLASLIELLESLGAPAYIDERDHSMPDSTSAATASELRIRMVELPLFMLATSQNIKNSRWAPWELGFADGKKSPTRIALFPLVPSAGQSPAIEQEYLDFYPRVERIGGDYVVWDPRARAQTSSLRNWLRQS